MSKLCLCIVSSRMVQRLHFEKQGSEGEINKMFEKSKVYEFNLIRIFILDINKNLKTQ